MSGCRFLPPNYLGVVTAEQAGPHPQMLRFTQGVAVETGHGERGVILLASREVVLLFDHCGPANRVQLLFRVDGDRAFYERIGQRLEPLATADGLGQVGVRARRVGNEIRGSIDAFVTRTERDGLEVSARYEHYPRVIRLVGYFAVPAPHPHDPALDFALDPQLPGRTVVSRLAALGWSESSASGELPQLPIVDVKYLVPTTLVDRLRDLP